jgi:hypothetical protein
MQTASDLVTLVTTPSGMQTDLMPIGQMRPALNCRLLGGSLNGTTCDGLIEALIHPVAITDTSQQVLHANRAARLTFPISL